MADFIACPPLPACCCYVCTRRRYELQLAARIESELLAFAERGARPSGKVWTQWRPTPKELAVPAMKVSAGW